MKLTYAESMENYKEKCDYLYDRFFKDEKKFFNMYLTWELTPEIQDRTFENCSEEYKEFARHLIFKLPRNAGFADSCLFYLWGLICDAKSWQSNNNR